MAELKQNNKILRKRIERIEEILTATYGPQKCCLEHQNPFELLVATILSAQCTDKKVNQVTPALFRRYPDPAAFALADLKDVESMIHECGFFHAKADHIVKASRMIMEEYGGEVPRDMEDLTKLPGVGRKTANVVLGDAFGIPGLPVDTHVKRLSNLIGLVHSDNPEEIESVLCGALSPEKWSQFSHVLILHGRTRCPARRPDCAHCEIAELCDFGRKGCTAGESGKRKVASSKPQEASRSVVVRATSARKGKKTG